MKFGKNITSKCWFSSPGKGKNIEINEINCKFNFTDTPLLLYIK